MEPCIPVPNVHRALLAARPALITVLITEGALHLVTPSLGVLESLSLQALHQLNEATCSHLTVPYLHQAPALRALGLHLATSPLPGTCLSSHSLGLRAELGGGTGLRPHVTCSLHWHLRLELIPALPCICLSTPPPRAPWPAIMYSIPPPTGPLYGTLALYALNPRTHLHISRPLRSFLDETGHPASGF